MGKYIVFDGMDGSGKGTQIELLKKKLDPKCTIFTREPGGTPLAEEIRKTLLENPLARESTPLNDFLLFWAAREDLLNNLVGPSLDAEKNIISDRGDSSTFAFQIFGEEHEELLDVFLSLRSLVFDTGRGRNAPDEYVIFDLPAEVSRDRVMKDTKRKKNCFDERDLSYYERVRKGFKMFAKCVNAKVVFVDANRDPQAIHLDVLKNLSGMGLELN